MSIDPILPFKLSLQFGFHEHRVGLFFFNFTVLVALVTLSLLFVPTKVRKTLFILVGNFIIVIGSLLAGPSKLLGLPNTLTLMRTGMWTAGTGEHSWRASRQAKWRSMVTKHSQEASNKFRQRWE